MRLLGNSKFSDLSVGEWKRAIDVGDRLFSDGKVRCSIDVGKSGRGAIVNISSTRALMSEPGNEAYSASKAGILGLTHALANSLGPSVRVNEICPGWILHENEQVTEQDHKQHLTGRAGVVEDIANLIEFLIDDEKSGFITGQYFVVDGGMTKKMIYI